MDNAQELFFKDLAKISAIEANLYYMCSHTTEDYIKMLCARSSLNHSPAYVSGSILHQYSLKKARQRDRALLALFFVVCHLKQLSNRFQISLDIEGHVRGGA